MKRKTSRPLLFLFALTLVCAGCSRTSENATNLNDNSQTLRIATSFKIQNLDPLKAAHYFLIEYGVAETPLYLDDNSRLQSWLLESCERIDRLNWRLRLRPNVKFHNGNLLTAEKLAAAMNRQLENSPAAKAVISNAKIRVTGERELILTTEKPDPNVPAALADENVFPVYDVAAIELAGSDAAQIIKSGSYTGPFRIASLDNREMRLEKFADYWRGTVSLETVTIKFISDAQARVFAVQANEVDVALYPPIEARRTLINRTEAFFVTHETPSGGPRLFFNLRLAPFNELAVRRATSLGIDYEQLAKNVLDGAYEVANGFYPAKYAWAINNQKTDFAEARRILDEAGWRAGGGTDKVRARNGMRLTATLLVYPQQPDWLTLATALQAQLAEIGFEIKIRQVDDINYALKNQDGWNLAVNSPGIITAGGAPDPFLREYFLSDGENNRSGVTDLELDKLIKELSQTFDENRRGDLLKQIQKIIVSDQVYEVRPVFARARAIVNQKYRNYSPSPRLHHVTNETKPAAN